MRKTYSTFVMNAQGKKGNTNLNEATDNTALNDQLKELHEKYQTLRTV